MGNYLNPGNNGFQEMRNGIYVDKTGLIGVVNRTIGTIQKLTCVRHPRRFGKSFVLKCSVLIMAEPAIPPDCREK